MKMKKLISLAALATCILLLTNCTNGNTPTNTEQQTVNEQTTIEENSIATSDNAIVEEDDEDDVLVEKSAASADGIGDFNGDGNTETCWLQTPKFQAEEMDCIGDCNCFIKFSDQSIPAIKIDNCIGGKPEILGDLDGNGTTEIGILPEWWTSCWHDYLVYTFANGKWQLFVDPIITHCNLFEELEVSGEPIIKKISDSKFIVHYSEFDESMSDIVSKTKTVSKRNLE